MNRSERIMTAFAIYIAWWIATPNAVRAEPKKHLSFGFHRGVDAVQAVIEQVAAIQNGRDMLILRKPPRTTAEE